MQGTIYNMDCIEGLEGVEPDSVDMVLCDLPYGVTRNRWDEVIPMDVLWDHYRRVVKDNGAIVLFGQGMFTARLMTSNPKMWRYNLVWDKRLPSGFLNARKMPLRSHEDLCVFYKRHPAYHPQMETGEAVHSRGSGGGWQGSSNYGTQRFVESRRSNEKYPKSVLRFDKPHASKALHPTEKPVALLEYLIRTYTDEGDTVLDNAFGSGSTLVAAMRANRSFIGFETDEGYFETACRRLAGE